MGNTMNSKSPDLRTQRLCIFSGIAWAVLFFLALIMAGQFPPPSPLQTGSELLAQIRDNWFMAKASIPIGILGAGLAIPFNALIAGHIARIEAQDQSMPLLAITSFGGGMANVVASFLVFFPFAALFYRQDANPDVARMVHDFVWLIIIMAFSAPALQMVCIALAGFRDKSSNPVFPRWYAYLSLWIAFGTCTGCIGIYFFEGPFAWNGIISFWIPASAFGVWMISLCVMFFKHINASAAGIAA